MVIVFCAMLLVLYLRLLPNAVAPSAVACWRWRVSGMLRSRSRLAGTSTSCSLLFFWPLPLRRRLCLERRPLSRPPALWANFLAGMRDWPQRCCAWGGWANPRTDKIQQTRGRPQPIASSAQDFSNAVGLLSVTDSVECERVRCVRASPDISGSRPSFAILCDSAEGCASPRHLATTTTTRHHYNNAW